MVRIQPNVAGIILRGRGFKVILIAHVTPMGAQGEGLQWPKVCKLKHRMEDSRYLFFIFNC